MLDALKARINMIIRRRQAYRAVFATPEGKIVLADLAAFCGANTDLFHPDPHVTANNTGKFRVLQRVLKFLNMEDAQLQELIEQQRATDFQENANGD